MSLDIHNYCLAVTSQLPRSYLAVTLRLPRGNPQFYNLEVTQR